VQSAYHCTGLRAWTVAQVTVDTNSCILELLIASSQTVSDCYFSTLLL